MTKQLYIPIIICGLVLFGYLFGTSRGHNNCLKQIAEHTAQISQQQNTKKEKINAEIYRTGITDIRNILRTKYTIAD